MAGIAFRKNAETMKSVQAPPTYGINRIVYVRGTKEGYEKIKSLTTDLIFQKQDVINDYGKNILNRYTERRQSILDSELRNLITGEYYTKEQEEWVNYIVNNLSIQNEFGGDSVATALKKISGLCWQLNSDKRTQAINNIEQEVNKLRQQYTSLSSEDKINFLALESPEMIEGLKVNMEKAEQQFQKLQSIVDKIKNDPTIKPYPAQQRFASQLGFLNEATTNFMATKAAMAVSKQFSNIKNVKVISTGAETPQQIANQTISTMAKPDTVIEYTVKINDNEFVVQQGLSLKASASVVDSSGNWKYDKNNKNSFDGIKIFDTVKAWNLVQSVFDSPRIPMDNAALNTLVWANSNSGEYRMISRGVIAKYFDQFLAGGGTKLGKSGTFDIADCLVVSGRPIPIISILNQVSNIFEANPEAINKYVSTKFNFHNDWIDASGEKKSTTYRKRDAVMAFTRSDKVRQEAVTNLYLTVKLNGRNLYELAK